MKMQNEHDFFIETVTFRELSIGTEHDDEFAVSHIEARLLYLRGEENVAIEPLVVGQARAIAIDLTRWLEDSHRLPIHQLFDNISADISSLGPLLFYEDGELRPRWRDYFFTRDEIVYLDRLWVLEPWQHQGLGSAFVERLLMDWHVHAGVVATIPIPVIPGTGELVDESVKPALLKRLHRFYRRLGFCPVRGSQFWVHYPARRW